MRMAKDCQPAGVSPDLTSQPPWQKRFETRSARYSAKSTSSGSDAAHLVFRRLVLDPLFSDFPNPFSRRSAWWESYGANAQPCPTHVRFRCLAGNPRLCLRSVRKRSRCANLEHSIPVARPARFLSFRAAHANARGSFRGDDPKKVCKCTTNDDAFPKSVRCSIQKLRNHPEPSQRKEVRKEHECYRYQKGNRGNVGNH